MFKTLLDKLGWTGHGTKILGGLGALAGVVAMSLTPEQLVAILGAKGPGALLIAGGVLTYLRGLTNSANGVPPSNPQAKMHFLTIVLAALLMLSVLSGCASWTGSQKLAATVGVQYATMKFIEHEPEVKRESRALKVINTVIALKGVAEDTSATVDTLQGYAITAVSKADLGPADMVLANTLIAAVTEELKHRVKMGVLKEDDKIAVLAVLDSIVVAARSYVPLASSP